jgi:hypothetical protein
MFEYKSGGRRVSADQFFANIKDKLIDSAMQELEARARGAAASIIDPETGKHAQVFVRRKDATNLILSTKGANWKDGSA